MSRNIEKIYLVIESYGQYDDHYEEIICGFHDKNEAERVMQLCSREQNFIDSHIDFIHRIDNEMGVLEDEELDKLYPDEQDEYLDEHSYVWNFQIFKKYLSKISETTKDEQFKNEINTLTPPEIRYVFFQISGNYDPKNYYIKEVNVI